MTWPQVAFVALLLSALAAGWYKYSISTGTVAKGLELYLWVIPILSIGVLKVIHGRTGLKGLVPIVVTHLAIVAWAMRTVYPAPGGVSIARVGGVLLIFGAAIVWIGAHTFALEDLGVIATHPADHLFTVGGFLIGGLLSLGGFVALRIVLRERGDALFSELGLVALVIATVGWIFHLAFRATVLVVAAQESSVTVPAWYPPLRLWAGAMYAAYMVLAYLSISAFGAAMRKTGWAGKGWGRTFVAFGLISAVTFVARVGSDFPLQVQFMPYAMGMILLRRATIAPTTSQVASETSS